MFDIRLRAWAIAQFLYSAILFLRYALPRLGLILIGRDAARKGVSFTDLCGVAADELYRTALLGRLNDCAFTGLDNDFPELIQGDATNVFLLHSVAVRTLERIAGGDPRKTGWLRGYAKAQLRHFARCTACRASVYETITDDVVRTRRRRALFARAGLPRTFDR